MLIKGNYWLELIAKEKDFRKEIESAVRGIVGRCFPDYESLHGAVMSAIRNRLEHYGLSKNLGEFKLDYDVDLHYDDEFFLNGFHIKSVCLVDEVHF